MEHVYLIAEDDEDTQFLIRSAYATLDLAHPVFFVNNGEELIEYLEGAGPYHDRQQFPLPSITLLDLKMPRKNGLEVLSWLRQSPFRELVVVMFSGSDEEKDVREAYRAGVNSFVHKPASFQELIQTLSSIHHYWFGCNYFPHLEDGLGGKGTASKDFTLVREKAH